MNTKIVRNFRTERINKNGKEYIVAKYEVHIGPNTKVYCSHIVTPEFLDDLFKKIQENNDKGLETFFNNLGLILRSGNVKDNKLYLPKSDNKVLDKYTIN